MTQHRQPTVARAGIRPGLLLIVYIGLILAPLAMAGLQGLPLRGWRDELSSALAICALAGLYIEFLLSGRFRSVSGRIGIDKTMRLHQLLARWICVVFLIHPFIYSTPVLDSPLPWDFAGQHALGLTLTSFVTGTVAWLALTAMVLFALFRAQWKGTYESWRAAHGVAALLVALFGWLHALEAGRYSNHRALTVYWSLLLAVALFTLLWVYVLKPLWQRRHPYRVRSVAPAALRTWRIAVEPDEGDVIEFAAGQFVWLNVGHGPMSLCENPFSISSPPAQKGHLEFLIKEVGDFTGTVGQIEAGTIAYVDGPHGNLTVEGREAAGIVLIAGGVGVAPLFSILSQLYRNRDRRPVVLVYGNRVVEQIVEQPDLPEIEAALDLRIEHVIGEPPAGWPGHVGRLDAELVKKVLDRPDAAAWLYVVCGPPAMIVSVEQGLRAIGVPDNRILSERFSYD